MKQILKILFIAVFLLFGSNLFGQLFTINPESGVIYMQVKKGEEVTREFYFDNISDSSIWLKWEITKNTLPENWGYSLCDNRICYNTVPSSAYMEPIAIGDFGFMKLAVWNTTEGSGEIELRISDKQSKQESYILFIVEHKPEIPPQKTLTIYPNPVGNERLVSLSYDLDRFEYAEIINFIGTSVKEIELQQSDQLSIDLNGLPQGVYFIRFTSKDNMHRKTIRIVLN